MSTHPDQLLRAAMQKHQAGDFAQAQQLYQQVLAKDPRQPEALHYLGVLLHQLGHHAAACEHLELAASIKTHDAQVHYHLASALREAGKASQALGALKRCIEINPSYAPAYSLKGSALKDMGRLVEACAAHRQAIAIKPDFAQAYYNLGITLEDMGNHEEAVAAYQQAIVRQPKLLPAYLNLGNLLGTLGRLRESAEAYRKALAIQPRDARCWSNLGNTLCRLGQHEEAVAACRQAVKLQPNYHLAYNNLGNALLQMDHTAEAVQAYQQAITLKPDDALAYSNLGNVLRELEQLDEAVAACRRAVELNPTLAEAHYNLGNALKYVGLADEAVQAYQHAIELRGNFPEAHTNLAYFLHFHAGSDAGAIHTELRRWHQQYALPLQAQIQPHPQDRNPDRRLKIGYVSPDFYQQAESFFTVPLLAHHDHAGYEIHCYSSVAKADDITQRLHGFADVWHEVKSLDDQALAQRIREDRIDILIDLTMHMGNHRALVFARKPSPVQVCWLAYPGGTGMDAMDYRITDAHMDPLDADVSCYTEKSVRMPDCWVVYDPLVEVPARPAMQTGPVTFGSLNNPAKMNQPLLKLWARVLQAVPDSRLLLLVISPEYRRLIALLLAEEGVTEERIVFVGRMSRSEYLRMYDRIDIALDTLPYNGITTTCDALYMGTPVVTLAGNTAAGRAGLAMLRTIELGELAAQSPDELVEICRGLAQDQQRLESLRAGLRQRMQQSPLMDAPRFARNMEAAYQKMWQAWCSASPVSTMG